MTYNEGRQAIKDAIKLFPVTFGLRAFPKETFRVSEQASYTTNGVVMLYTQVLRWKEGSIDTHWVDFCKGTVSELEPQIVTLCTCGEGDEPGLAHSDFCPANNNAG